MYFAFQFQFSSQKAALFKLWHLYFYCIQYLNICVILHCAEHNHSCRICLCIFSPSSLRFVAKVLHCSIQHSNLALLSEFWYNLMVNSLWISISLFKLNLLIINHFMYITCFFDNLLISNTSFLLTLLVLIAFSLSKSIPVYSLLMRLSRTSKETYLLMSSSSF